MTSAAHSDIPYVRCYHGPRRYEIPAEFIVFDSAVRESERQRRNPSESFANKSVYVWQIITVAEVRKAVGTNERVKLRLGAFLCVWIQGHRDEEGL